VLFAILPVLICGTLLRFVEYCTLRSVRFVVVVVTLPCLLADLLFVDTLFRCCCCRYGAFCVPVTVEFVVVTHLFVYRCCCYPCGVLPVIGVTFVTF